MHARRRTAQFLQHTHSMHRLPQLLARGRGCQRLLSTSVTAASSSTTIRTGTTVSESDSIFYSHYPLDRAADVRSDANKLAALLASPSARATPVCGSRVLVQRAAATTSNSNSDGGSSASCAPVWLPPSTPQLQGEAAHAAVPPLFLGLSPDDTQAPHFAVAVQHGAAADALAAATGGSWVAARNAGPDMAPGDAALVAVASGLAAWNVDAQFNGANGSPTQPQDGGFSRKCSASGRVLYPRVDPAIITLVTAGADWCLLGRKPDWVRGRYSTLAGFLEIGETLEQALVREVAEESGVDVDAGSVRYVASQPWPFPRSLMVGFYAGVAGRPEGASGAVEQLSQQARNAMIDSAITPDEVAAALCDLQLLQKPVPQADEMADVRWFHRDWLLQAIACGPEAAPGGFMIPGNHSLAHRLIKGWLGNTTQQKWQEHQQVPVGTHAGWPAGQRVPQVEIDAGIMKYVLLRLSDPQSGASKLLVRGAAAAAYHNHILQATKAQVAALAPGLSVEVLGGGRIEHYPEQRVINVYGYSAAYGPAVHEVTVGLLRRWFPFYEAADISCSYEGY